MAEAIDSALTLLVAGGIPSEVVVNDGGEDVLEVDAFGEAVGGDENGLLGFTEEVDPLLTFVGGILAGDGLDGCPLELRGEMQGDVAGGSDIAAEDNRTEPVFEQAAKVGDEGGKFGIAFGAVEAMGGGDEGFEFTGLLVHGGSRLDVALGKFGTGAVVEAFVFFVVFGLV